MAFNIWTTSEKFDSMQFPYCLSILEYSCTQEDGCGADALGYIIMGSPYATHCWICYKAHFYMSPQYLNLAWDDRIMTSFIGNWDVLYEKCPLHGLDFLRCSLLKLACCTAVPMGDRLLVSLLRIRCCAHVVHQILSTPWVRDPGYQFCRLEYRGSEKSNNLY